MSQAGANLDMYSFMGLSSLIPLFALCEYLATSSREI